MADNIFREGMQVPSPNEGPTYDRLKDYSIQGKILKALEKSGMDINLTGFEMYHQKGKLLVVTQEGLKIEFRSGEHYSGKGDALKFLPEATQYIRDTLKAYNNEVKKLKKSTHAALDNISSGIQSA